MEYGTVLKFDKKSKEKVINSCIERIDTASTAFEKSSQMVRNSNENLFIELRKIFPELDEYDFTYERKDKTVVVRGKKGDENV